MGIRFQNGLLRGKRKPNTHNTKSGLMCKVCNFYFRCGNSTHVLISTKFSEYRSEYGKLYASKEKLYIQHTAFIAPKASPLDASIIFQYTVLSKKSWFYRVSKISCYKLHPP